METKALKDGSSMGCCRGFEPERISDFKAALGLSDENAAAVHIDVGRRFSRQRQEASKQADKSAQLKVMLCWHLLFRKALQKIQ